MNAAASLPFWIGASDLRPADHAASLPSNPQVALADMPAENGSAAPPAKVQKTEADQDKKVGVNAAACGAVLRRPSWRGM